MTMLNPRLAAWPVPSRWPPFRIVYLLSVASLLVGGLVFLASGGSAPGLPPRLQQAWTAASQGVRAGIEAGYEAAMASWSSQTEEAPPPPLEVPDGEHIAICAAVRDQSADMVEWLVHHYHHMGVRRFYIMDDGSEPPLSAFEYPGVPRSALTFTYQPREMREQRMQMAFYTWCLERWRDRHAWIAFIDADEFLDTPGTETLPQILATLEKNETVGALGVNWRFHTSNGLLTRPSSVRKAFTECVANTGHGSQAGVNRHIKSIVKTSKGISPNKDPHHFHLVKGSITVGEHGDAIPGAFRNVTRDRVALSHYAMKSREEYVEKTLRGSAQSNHKTEAFWHAIETSNRTGCIDMVHWSP